MNTRYDIAVVGGGIAGYTAALTAKSLKRSCLLLGEAGFGKKLERAEYVRNFPSFTGKGEAFAALLEKQRLHEKIEKRALRIDGVYADGEGFTLTCGEQTFQSRSVILATGVEWAGRVRGEEEFLGRGVSYCAVCDGALYRGKHIAAVLSSEEMAEEVEYLAGFAKSVACFCIGCKPTFRAENIEVRTGVPLAVEGDLRVRTLRLKEGEEKVDGVFFLRQSAPPSALVGGLKTEGGHVVTARDGSTNLPGLFAAGDVTGRPYQYVKAAGEGCVAAYSAHAFLGEKK